VANTKSAAKRAKQGERRRQHNVALRSRMRTAIKKVIKAIEAGDTAEAAIAFKAGAAEVASMVNKGLTHKNKAARHKSRLNKAVKALTVKQKKK
jgi:small subunit ribosomal protein S20